LDQKVYGYIARPVRYRGEVFQPKSELHITILSQGTAEKTRQYLQSDTDGEQKIRSLIASSEWAYRQQDKYFYVKDEAGNESIIQMATVPGLEQFLRQMERLSGESLEWPPTHVTLYTRGDPKGIGLPDQLTFERDVKTEVHPDEFKSTVDLGIKLVIFDVDGTLAETYTQNLLPRVQEFFNLVYRSGCPVKPKIALATNQGGVGMRYWMEKNHFGKPENYPTRQDVEMRLRGLVDALGGDPHIPVYASYRYRTKEGKLTPVPPEAEQEPRWQAEWRKPEPGMLLQAMTDAGVMPEQTLFVGDSEDDRTAAQAAGCAFLWARDFFSENWQECADLADLLNRA
jgi:HAD superfamily hydrolase (TIGR01662 family)